MTALALEVMNTPMGPYLNLMEEMTMEQKLALVAFLINTMQHEEPKKKTSDEDFVKELMALRYEGEMSAEEMKQMIRDSHHFGDRNIKRSAGKIADEFDMMIGGQALTAGLTVVTDNVKHFEPMPEVKVENWMDRPQKF